jgi:hypothetical protein
MPSNTLSFSEFSQRLDAAMRDIDQLAAVDTDPMIGSIQRQLRFVKEWTRGGTRPAQQDLDRLTFGLMASRTVHDTDARLANELYSLSSFLIHWPPTQPVRT